MIAAGTSNQNNGQYEMQNHSDYPVEVSLKEVKETENAGLTFLDAAADPTDSKNPIRLDLLHSTNLPNNRFTESIIGVNASTPETSLGILDGQHVAHESPPSSIDRFTFRRRIFWKFDNCWERTNPCFQLYIHCTDRLERRLLRERKQSKKYTYQRKET